MLISVQVATRDSTMKTEELNWDWLSEERAAEVRLPTSHT